MASDGGPTSVPGKGNASRGAAAEKRFHEEDVLGKAYDFALLNRLWPFVRPYRRAFFASLLLLPVLSELLVAQPRVIRGAIDKGILGRDPSAINRAALVLAVLLLGEFAVRFVQVYLTQWVGQKVMADLRHHIFSFLHGQKLSFFDRQPIGRLVTRATNDVDALGELFASGAITAVGDLITLGRIVLAMMALSPKLSLFAFAGAVPLAYLVDRFRRRAREAFREIRGKTARMNAYLNEQVSGVAVVQAYGQEQRCANEFNEINEAYRLANHAAIRYDALLFAVVEMFSSICVATMLFVGARAVGIGTPAASMGTLVAFVQYIQRFFEPMRDLSGKYTVLQSSMAGAQVRFVRRARGTDRCLGGRHRSGKDHGPVAFATVVRDRFRNDRGRRPRHPGHGPDRTAPALRGRSARFLFISG
jgi:ATP-binding cassette subfamily B multidrug efflux pump